jgi:hypothetical protein
VALVGFYGAQGKLALVIDDAAYENAQTAASAARGHSAATEDNADLLTFFLKHDQSRPLSELNAQLAKQGFYKTYPPPGVMV